MTNKQVTFALIGIIGVIVLGGAYFAITASRTDTTTATQTPSQGAATQSDLFANQTACAALQSTFETSWENDFQQTANTSFGQYLAGAGWRATLTDFVVGYSPSLHACVGGFTSIESKDPCPSDYVGAPASCVIRGYSIINISTNQVIQNYDKNMSPTKTDQGASSEYMAKLSQLTNGQIH